MPRSLSSPLLLLIALLALPLTSCSDGCSLDAAKDASDEMYAALDTFTEVRREADIAAPSLMQPYIDEMTAIRNQVSAFEVPACAEGAHASLVAGMDKFIEGYSLYATTQTSPEIQPLFDEGQAHLLEFDEQIQELAASFQ